MIYEVIEEGVPRHTYSTDEIQQLTDFSQRALDDIITLRIGNSIITRSEVTGKRIMVVRQE